MPPKRPSWADEVDSSPAGTPHSRASSGVGNARTPAGPPFAPFLAAYLQGLSDATVGRESMFALQRILQQHPRSSALLRGSLLWHLIFYVDFRPEVKALHVISYLAAVHNGWVTAHQRNLWLQLLQIECLMDFPFPILWSVVHPDRQLPRMRRL